MRYKWFAALTAAVMLTGVLCGCGKKEAPAAVDEKPVLNYTAPVQGEEIVRISIKDYDFSHNKWVLIG